MENKQRGEREQSRKGRREKRVRRGGNRGRKPLDK
jgi:hypothetical protein